VGFSGYVTFEKWVGFTVELDSFASVNGRTCDKCVTSLLVQEHHFAVFGMDAYFHDVILLFKADRQQME